MADIVLKDIKGNDVEYQGIKRIRVRTTDGNTEEYLGIELENAVIEVDFSEGDMALANSNDRAFSSVRVVAPETLVPENIRKGVEVAGVVGDFVGDAEETTVELDMAEGDQTVVPSADGKVLTQVTVKKPEALVPENIRLGTQIGGVEGECEVIEYVQTEILAEQEYEGFFDIFGGAGVYAIYADAPLALTAGETYRVVWDGEEYFTTASEMDGDVFIGNSAIGGVGVDTGEPFGITSLLIATLETDASHIIGISQKTRADAEAVEVELDFSGGDMTVVPSEDKLISRATIRKPEALIGTNIVRGAEVAGVAGEAVTATEDVEVELDMADGDQTVTASSENVHLGQVILKKPETLIPENIAEGINIAGIIGTLAAGGGKLVCKYMTFKGANTVTHDLGVTPDLVLVLMDPGSPSIYYCTLAGLSTAASNAGVQFPLNNARYFSSNKIYQISKGAGIDVVDTTLPIHSANAQTISFCPSKLSTSTTYWMYLIGGLT